MNTKTTILTLAILMNAFGFKTLAQQPDGQSKTEKNDVSFVNQVTTISKCAVFKNSICAMDVHPTKDIVVTSDSNGNVDIWTLNDHKRIHMLEHEGGAPSVAFSNDGSMLATGGYDSIARVWDVNTGKLMYELTGHERMIFNITFSKDDKKLATSGADDTAIIWDLSSKEHIVLKKHAGDVWGLTFSPNGKQLLTGGEDDIINIWDVESGQLIRTLTEHNGAVLSLTFSNNGKLLASGGDDYSVKLWNVETWEAINTFKDGSYSIYDIAFSADDRFLVAGGRDKGLLGEFLQYHFQINSSENDVSARVWNVQEGKVIQQLNAHSNDIDNINFNSDGTSLITSGVDGRVVTYEVNY